MRKSAFSTVLSAGIVAALLISGSIAFADPDVTLRRTAGDGVLEHDVYPGTSANAVAGANRMPTEFMDTVSNVSFEARPRCTVIGGALLDDAWREYRLYKFLALLIIMITAWWWLDKDD